MNEDHERERMRLDAAGALAHDMRTPLAAIVMALDVARSLNPDGDLVLDRELEGMLRGSVEALDSLLADFHESSRIERSMLQLVPEQTELRAVIDEAVEAAVSNVTVDWPAAEEFAGEWDAPRLTRALRYLVDAADQLGDGQKEVALAVNGDDQRVIVRMTSGDASGEERSYGADAGYPYFHACLLLEAMGGRVTTERFAGGARLTAEIPRL